MKTRPLVLSASASPLLDGLFLMVAGAMCETQTRGAVKPFGRQRLTLKALALRHERSGVY